MKHFIHILLYTLFPFLLNGQIKNIGSPSIRNYPKSVYSAGTQNWGITQDQNGFMYFANNEGVLIFDGLNWEQIIVSQAKPIRSIFTDSQNRIYIGLLNDFGYLSYDAQNILSFNSLRDLLPQGIDDFDDIWRIYEINGGIVFQTYEYLFLLRDETISVIQPRVRFHFSFLVDDRLFIHEPGIGIYELKNNQLTKVSWSDDYKDMEIAEILDSDGTDLLICTSDNGIYKIRNGKNEKWNTPVTALVEKYKLFCGKNIIGNFYAFGTILNGLIISDADGNIIQHINKNNGLQNNTVLSLYTDKRGNLWVGLDNGIDYIEVNSPISYFTDYEGIGTGYCARIFQNKLYFGTNQGLFVREFDGHSHQESNFELVKNTAGQVWSLYIYDNQLICGHNGGTFLVNDREAIKISGEEGAWKYIPAQQNPDALLGGHYYGLVLLKKSTKGWLFDKKIAGFNESSRFIQQDNAGNIWISHGARGIMKVRLNEKMDSVNHYKLYTSADGLPSDEQNIVMKLDADVFVSTIEGLYLYNQEQDLFQKSEKLNELFNVSGRLKTIEKDEQGNIWCIAQDETLFLRLNQDSTYTRISAPFRQLAGKYVNEFESIYPYSSDHIFMGIDNGFAHFSSSLPKAYDKTFKSFITRIELPYIDSIINNSFNPAQDPEYSFPYKKNSFRFYYTSPFYENIDQLEFSYSLTNFSDQWSEWSSTVYKDFTNLREGEYTFRLKAKNIYQVESEISEFKFSIKPPWYRSIIAFYSFGFAIILFTFAGIKYLLYRIRRSKAREREKHQKEMKEKEEQFQHQALVSEKEIIRLRNEKLRAEMVHRDKELANQTMSIIQKNKFLLKLKEELDMIQKSTEDPPLRTKLLVISRRLDKEIDNKQQNKIFETYFEEVHEEFFSRIKEKHPNLSPRELNLSAYIRMNLATKEIAALLNITSRGVEIGRYRLRKKLDLPREINLSTYLSNI